jgi:hypothetical protein
MTKNPLMLLLEPLEKLIIEHGSAIIQTKHIALLKEQVVLFEKKIIDLEAKLVVSGNRESEFQTKISTVRLRNFEKWQS